MWCWQASGSAEALSEKYVGEMVMAPGLGESEWAQWEGLSA